MHPHLHTTHATPNLSLYTPPHNHVPFVPPEVGHDLKERREGGADQGVQRAAGLLGLCVCCLNRWFGGRRFGWPWLDGNPIKTTTHTRQST